MHTITNYSKKIFAFLALSLSGIVGYSQDIVAAGAMPHVFTHQNMADSNNESVLALLPDEKTAFIADGQTIVYSTCVNGVWSKTATAPFSGQWKDWDPAMKPDGSRIVFVSTRRPDDYPKDSVWKSAHLWYVDRVLGGGWSAPHHFDAPVNEKGFNDFGPSVSGLGSVCFCSRNRDGNKGMGGYYAKWMGDHYAKPVQLKLNGDAEIYDPFIANDESYIIFVSNGELYISYRTANGWAQGKKLPAVINNGNGNSDPYVSPDGKTLYYNQDKTMGILMIPVKIPAKG